MALSENAFISTNENREHTSGKKSGSGHADLYNIK